MKAPGPALPGFVVLMMICGVRLAIVLWGPFLIVAWILSVTGIPSRILLSIACLAVPGLALWYWIQDLRRRMFGAAAGMPDFVVKLMAGVGAALLWGFGPFLSSIGLGAYRLFLTLIGQNPANPEANARRLQYKVVFAVSYSVGFCLLASVFLFVWGPPKPDQLFIWNFLSLGVPFETGITVGFLLSLVVWPLLWILEKVIGAGSVTVMQSSKSEST